MSVHPPFRVCVVGAGRWGLNHIRTLHELGHLGGFVEIDEARRKTVADQYPDALAFPSLETSLAVGFDGYVVATPAASHVAVAKKIIENRVPLLVEKPLALSVADAQSLVTAAETSGVPLMVGHVLLFHPAFEAMKTLVQQGRLGKIQYLYSNRLNLGQVRSEENILWAFAPHDLSLFQYLLGDFPEEVLSRGGTFLQPGVHDTTMTTLRYPGNIVGHIFVSWLHPFKEHRFVLIGSQGMLTFSDVGPDRQLLFYEKGIDWVKGAPVHRDGPAERIAFSTEPPLARELLAFLEAIQTGQAPQKADGHRAIEVLRILEMATSSLDAPVSTPSKATSRKLPYFVHESAYVDEPCHIGSGTSIWHFVHVQAHAHIGNDCSLGQNVNIGPHVRIGDRVRIQNNVSVYEGVTLEEDVFVGPSVVFTNVNRPRSALPRGKKAYDRTLIKKGATLGANATVVCGHTVGAHAFIGAGAVVTENVSDHALMVGVPAKQVGWACVCGQRLDQGLACPDCGQLYVANATGGLRAKQDE
jgi:UDP-2-acetamido-3-amino-2,3-dideoxy-glucuronate N-acetyltransferase